MANPIPPLVCSTPPPIDDFDEISQIDDRNDIDYGEDETTDAEFGSFEGPSLPNTPRHVNIISIISEDVLVNDISNNCNSNNLEEHALQIETQHSKICDEDVTVDFEKLSIKESKIDENDDSLSIEIQRTDEERIDESNEKHPDNFECRWVKYESPPSLELTVQVVSEESDSFDKISNSDKDLEKDLFDKPSVIKSEGLTLNENPEEMLVASTKLPHQVTLEFDDFLKNTVAEHSLNIEDITNIENEIETSSSQFGTNSSKNILNETLDCKTNSGEIFPDNYIPDKDASEAGSSTGCEIQNKELIGKNCVPENEFIFEADFSQFENALSSDAIIKIEEIYCVCESRTEENVDPADEKLPKFQEVGLSSKTLSLTLVDNIENQLRDPNSTSQLEITTETNDDFEEDFGEFSDFKEASNTYAPATNAIKIENLSAKKSYNAKKTDTFSSILDAMFPVFGNCDINKGDNDNTSIKELAENYSIITNFDSTNALDYHWNNSTTRHALIKSLGIDSRNILYGEKWNCSMPKFASNLGFTPLEPLKPTKIENKIQKPTNSTMSNSCNGISKSNLIPDAEFDWNSSGLINPLDASHAHTLLLDYDLDQLVVVANLDNIKLDSYSSYLLTSSSSASTSTSTLLPTTPYCTANTLTNNGSTTTACPSLNYFEHRWVNNNNVTTGTTLGNGTIHNFSNNSTYLNSYAMINNTIKNNMFVEFGPNCHYAESVNQINTKNSNIINTVMNTTNATTNKNYDIKFDYSLSSRNKKQLEEKQDFEIHTTTNEPIEINSSVEPPKVENESVETNVSAEYEIRTEKILNDIEITGSLSSSNNENNSTEFTICPKTKPELANDDDDDNSAKSKTASIDIELPSASKAATTNRTEKLSIVDVSLGTNTNSINSKQILSTNITSQISINENTNNKLNENFIKQLNSYSSDYLNMGSSTATYVVPLKETHIFTPTKSDNPISQSTGGDFISTCIPNSNVNTLSSDIGCGINETIDFDYETAAAGTVINEKVIKKEYHDIEYDPSKFGLKHIDLQLSENNVISDVQNKSKESRNSDTKCLDMNDLEKKSTTSWNFHLNNFDDGIDKQKSLDSGILNSTDRSNPMSFIFCTNEPVKIHTTDVPVDHSLNVSAIPNDIIMSNDLNKKFADFKDTINSEDSFVKDKSQTLNNIEFIEDSNFSNLSKNTCDSFDDEFTDFQSVLPSLDYKNNVTNRTQSSNFIRKREDKNLDSNPISTNTSVKENDKSRNQTPTLPSDDRMILSPAILLPHSVSVNQSISLSETPKIEWPEPGISNDELARLEKFFPQIKSSPIINMEQQDNLSTSNTDEDWSDFMSVPPLPQSGLTQHSNQSPKTAHSESNLNIIYNPQSPTKVSTKRTTTHLNKSHDEDEWSDFISSAPVSSSTNPNSNFSQLTKLAHPANQHQWNYANKSNNCLTTGQQFLNHNNIFVPSQQEKQRVFLNNNNSKISQYLLNNTSAGHTDKHINSGSNNMQMNSLKPNDFIPHHHLQHQMLQKQQKILTQSANGGNIIGNNISFIPDLGFSSPQNQFINMTKRNYQRK